MKRVLIALVCFGAVGAQAQGSPDTVAARKAVKKPVTVAPQPAVRRAPGLVPARTGPAHGLSATATAPAVTPTLAAPPPNQPAPSVRRAPAVKPTTLPPPDSSRKTRPRNGRGSE
jgi:hypothetical protein